MASSAAAAAHLRYVGLVHAATVREDVRQRALGAKFAVSLARRLAATFHGKKQSWRSSTYLHEIFARGLRLHGVIEGTGRSSLAISLFEELARDMRGVLVRRAARQWWGGIASEGTSIP